MAKKRKGRNKGEAAKLEMTPMIDVVFQLLIFFIVTLKQEDILSHFNVSRPAPDTPPNDKPDIPDLLTIEVGRNAWVVNGRPFVGPNGLKTMDRYLTKIASYSKDASVIIKCTGDSPQSRLIQVLNICSREGMTKLSVFSM